MQGIGQYGNVDDGIPLAAKDQDVPRSAFRVPRSIGGDEVGLFYAPYVATYTDRYLWIADSGNQRISSVKLGYHKTARIPLKDARQSKGVH